MSRIGCKIAHWLTPLLLICECSSLWYWFDLKLVTLGWNWLGTWMFIYVAPEVWNPCVQALPDLRCCLRLPHSTASLCTTTASSCHCLVLHLTLLALLHIDKESKVQSKRAWRSGARHLTWNSSASSFLYTQPVLNKQEEQSMPGVEKGLKQLSGQWARAGGIQVQGKGHPLYQFVNLQFTACHKPFNHLLFWV